MEIGVELMIKICPNPSCEAVYHNCTKKQTRCPNCNGRIIYINEKTFWSKFSRNWFQYNMLTGEYYRPGKVRQLEFDF